ncbi:SufB/SufD family protein [Methanotorris igneus]|uniref:SufBD protein n=1 Tax=Methanotorris igneus (strain DSM 5666 / JCM 11834 / Kol 5) TaxID=880724 RepID=F6BB76_METIK|nr:SufD family Fe-S cluster assembly protein [Methanotorris igneus]AEF95961.1 SufBD protein [Methanotorris igneus Kol 5]
MDKDLKEILEAYKLTNGNPEELIHGKGPRMIVKENKILGVKDAEGIILDGKVVDGKIVAKIIVKEGYKFDTPMHMCFGVTEEEAEQIVDVEIILEDNSEITLMSHCSFPRAKNVKHIMDGKITVGKNAKFVYKEVHFHGEEGGVLVKPTVKATVKEGGVYISELTLTKGRIGFLEINADIDVEKNGVVDITTKTYAVKDDKVIINETVKLNEEGGKCIIKSRGAAKDNSEVVLKLKIEGNAPYCKGHIDCAEVIKGDAIVESIPIVVVRDDRARITHEAAIGSVDKKQVETLMAKGLDEDEATEIIVKGMIGE